MIFRTFLPKIKFWKNSSIIFFKILFDDSISLKEVWNKFLENIIEPKSFYEYLVLNKFEKKIEISFHRGSD